MAMEVKLGQELRLRQQLVMTPQLQQAIKILQLALPELEMIVQKELETNPMLEPLDRSPGDGSADGEVPDATPRDEDSIDTQEQREKLSSLDTDMVGTTTLANGD